jgi:hypothetical protein
VNGYDDWSEKRACHAIFNQNRGVLAASALACDLSTGRRCSLFTMGQGAERSGSHVEAELARDVYPNTKATII